MPAPRRLIRRGGGWWDWRILGDDVDVPRFEPEDGAVLQSNPPAAIIFMAEAVGVILNHPGQVPGEATIDPGQRGLVPNPAAIGVVLGDDRLPRVGAAGGGEEDGRQEGGQK